MANTASAVEVLAALPVPVLVCDGEGRIALVNGAAAALLGRDGGALAGTDLAALVPARLREAGGGPLHRLLEGRVASGDRSGYRMAILRRDGLEIEVECSAASTASGQLVLTLSVIHDEAEARGRPGSYRLIFEHAPLGILHFDERGVITECNENFVAIIGSGRRVLVGLNMLTLPDRDMVRCVRAALAGEIVGYEGDYRSATAGKVTPVSVLFAPILEEGRITGGVGIIRDDSERKAAMNALRQSEASFRALIEGTPDCIGVVRQERLVYANPTLARVLGYESAEAIIGRPIARLLHVEDLAHLPRGEEGPERPAAIALLRWLHADGRQVETEAAVVAIRFDGEPASAVVARDVTETNALRTRLAQADRLASLGTLAAGVAHEINNPLAYLMTSLQVALRLQLRNGERSMKRIGELVTTALEGADRVRRIVQELRLFSRMDDTPRAPVDVHAVLATALSLSRGEVKHRARVIEEYGDVPPVLGDEVRLGQVFLNLLINAAQAFPEAGEDGGSAVERFGGDEQEATPPPRPTVGGTSGGSSGGSDNWIRITTSVASEDRVGVEIADNGAGIPPELLPRVFEPFLTTKPVGVGTGLGLSICHGLVTALGGEIALANRAGGGTVVRVTLPIATEPLAAPPPAVLTRAAPAQILIIDDEPRLLSALAESLSERHEVAVATSGKEALPMLAEEGRFDLVLCDVMMPGMTGLELYAALRKSRPTIAERFAFMTGGVLSSEMYNALVATAQPRLDKPFTAADVEQLLIAREAALGSS